MILVKVLKIEFIDAATKRFSAQVMLQATWREPKLDNTVCSHFHFLCLPTAINFYVFIITRRTCESAVKESKVLKVKK